jgi:hypothetical protein
MYYVLYYSYSNINRIGIQPNIGGPWFSGAKINYPVPDPLEFVIDTDSVGSEMCAIYAGAYPVYRQDFIDALHEAGVDNLELFNVVIKNPIDGKVYTNYKAVNILGLIACANMEESVLMGDSDSTMRDVDFDELAIDESKAGGALFFRLAENVTAVIVHKKVADHVKTKNIPGIKFLLPENWSG